MQINCLLLKEGKIVPFGCFVNSKPGVEMLLSPVVVFSARVMWADSHF